MQPPLHRHSPPRKLGSVCRLMSFANGHLEMSPLSVSPGQMATLLLALALSTFLRMLQIVAVQVDPFESKL
jgi:hypothetical protein